MQDSGQKAVFPVCGAVVAQGDLVCSAGIEEFYFASELCLFGTHGLDVVPLTEVGRTLQAASSRSAMERISSAIKRSLQMNEVCVSCRVYIFNSTTLDLYPLRA